MLCKELEPGWRHPSTAVLWRASIEAHCGDMADKLVSEIGTEDVLGALKPIWVTTHVTVRRLRERIERLLLKLRKGQGLADPGENPAAWRGHLDHMLARRSRSAPRHLKALPYTEVAAFLRRLGPSDRRRQG